MKKKRKREARLPGGDALPDSAAGGPQLCAARAPGRALYRHAAGAVWELCGGVFGAGRGAGRPAGRAAGPALPASDHRAGPAYLEDSSRDLKHVYDTDSAVELFRPKLLGRTTEAVCLMLLDGQARLLYNDILSEGSISAVPVYIRRLLQLCIRYDAQHVLLAHNHPSGVALPSDGITPPPCGCGRPSMPSALSWRIISLSRMETLSPWRTAAI